MAEETAGASYVMYGAREVLKAEATHIARLIMAVEDAVEENPGLVFDLAKNIVESTCKTILEERGCPLEDNLKLPKLLKETLGNLRLVPERLDREKGLSASLSLTVGGLFTVVQGLAELRNAYGFASHGREASFQELEPAHALLVARSADAIVSFLFRVHRDYPMTKATPLVGYGDNPIFNDYIDKVNDPLHIFEWEYKASEVLFRMDPGAYADLMANFGIAQREAAAADETGATG